MNDKMFTIDVPFEKDGKIAKGTNFFDPKKPYLDILNACRLFEWEEKADGECVQVEYEGEVGVFCLAVSTYTARQKTPTSMHTSRPH